MSWLQGRTVRLEYQHEAKGPYKDRGQWVEEERAQKGDNFQMTLVLVEAGVVPILGAFLLTFICANLWLLLVIFRCGTRTRHVAVATFISAAQCNLSGHIS